jgi:hypothetical protein
MMELKHCILFLAMVLMVCGGDVVERRGYGRFPAINQNNHTQYNDTNTP